MTPAGLPHSEIPGSKRACRSPRHIAACHVFHRLSVPRHPPSTLSNLTIKCLDLMRSAVPCPPKDTSCISFFTHIQLSRNSGSRRPAVGAIVGLAPPLVSRLLVLFVAAVTDTTRRRLGVFRLS